MGLFDWLKRAKSDQPASASAPAQSANVVDESKLALPEAIVSWARRLGESNESDAVYRRIEELEVDAVKEIVEAMGRDESVSDELEMLLTSRVTRFGQPALEAWVDALSDAAVEEEQRKVSALQGASLALEDVSALATLLFQRVDLQRLAAFGDVLTATDQPLVPAWEQTADSGDPALVDALLRLALDCAGTEMIAPLFSHARPRVRAVAARASVNESGSEAARAKLLDDPDEEVRFTLARWCDAGNASDHDLCLKLLEDRGAWVRAAAAIALGRATHTKELGGVSATGVEMEFALAVAREDDDASARVRAAIVSDDLRMRRLALIAVDLLSGADALDAFDQLALVGTPLETVEFVGGLLGLEPALAERLATLALSDPPPYVRQAVCKALASQSDSDDVRSQLERLLDRGAPARTRRAALEAVGEWASDDVAYARRFLTPDEPLLIDALHAFSALPFSRSAGVRELLDELSRSSDPRIARFAKYQLDVLKKRH